MIGRTFRPAPTVTVLIAVSIAALAGCTTTQTRSALIETMPALEQRSVAELRVRVRSLVPLMIGIMEKAADDVLASSTDPQVRASALRFKAEGIPVMYRALFQPDPVAAFIDAWVFVAQIRGYVEDGAGQSQPEQVRVAVLDAVERMDAELVRAAQAATKKDDVSRSRDFVYDFARKHPIESPALRQSTEELLAALTAQQPLPLSASIGSLEQDLADVVARLDVLTGTLPKQVRWEAERGVYDLLGAERAAALPADVAALFEAVQGAGATIEGLPELVTVQREAVLAALRAEIGTLEQIVHEQRLAAQGFVTAERSAALEQLTSEREAVLAAIAAERLAAIEALRAERTAATADLERLSAALVDRVFLRVAQLLGGIVIVVILGVAALRLMRRRA